MFKNKKIKSKLAILVVAAVVSTGLVGCGKSTPATVADLVQASETKRNIKKKDQNGNINVNVKSKVDNEEEQNFSVNILQKTAIDNMDSDSKINFTVEKKDTSNKEDADEATKMLNEFISTLKDKEIVFKTRAGKSQVSSDSIKNILRGYLDASQSTGDNEENLSRGMIGFMAEMLPANSYISIPGSAIANTNPANIMLNGAKDSINLLPDMDQNKKELSVEELEQLSKLYSEFTNKAFGAYTFVNMSKKGDTFTYKATGNGVKKELANLEKYVQENKDTIKSELIELSKKANVIQNKKELTDEEVEGISKAFDEKIAEMSKEDAKKKIEDLKDSDISINITLVAKKDGSKLDMDMTFDMSEDKKAENDNESADKSAKTANEDKLLIKGSTETRANNNVKLEDFKGEEIPFDQLFSGLLFDANEKKPEW